MASVSLLHAPFLWVRTQWRHRQWKALLILALSIYVSFVVGHTLYGTLEALVTLPFTRRTVFLIFVGCLLRLGLLLALPTWLAFKYRARATESRLQKEDRATRRTRDRIARHYASLPSLTIFFPDAYQDDLSVCAYTGGFGATPRHRSTARHLNAASIIACPHVSQFPNTAQSSGAFVMPELRVVDVGRRASLLERLRLWLEEKLDYLFAAQVRQHVGHRYEWSGVPCAYGLEDDVEQGLNMARNVMRQHPLSRDIPIVFFGSGRGANVALSVYVRLTNEERRRVLGVVLEGLLVDPLFLRHLRKPFAAVRPRDSTTVDPLHTVEHFPETHETRFMVVVSRADWMSDTTALNEFYHKLRIKSSDQCTLVRLTHAPRGAYATDNSDDARVYEEAAFEFYESIANDY